MERTKLAIIQALLDGELSGDEIRQRLGALRINYGYSTLIRMWRELENEGLVLTRTRGDRVGRPSRIFSITEKGRLACISTSYEDFLKSEAIAKAAKYQQISASIGMIGSIKSFLEFRHQDDFGKEVKTSDGYPANIDGVNVFSISIDNTISPRYCFSANAGLPNVNLFWNGSQWNPVPRYEMGADNSWPGVEGIEINRIEHAFEKPEEL